MSIVICTHNRVDSALQTMASLANCDDPGISWELILVANACTDGTEAACRAAFIELGLPGRVVEEHRAGAGYARNLGLETASHEFIVYLDDDMTVERSFLSAYLNAANSFPEADLFAGKIVSVWPQGKPRWYPNADDWPIDGVIGNFSPALERGIHQLIPFGGNMAVRRRALKFDIHFPLDIGNQGRKMGFGEETAFSRALQNEGCLTAYLPDVVTHHHLQEKFRHMRYVLRRLIALNRSLIEQGLKPPPEPVKLSLRTGIDAVRTWTVIALRILRGKDWRPLLDRIALAARRSVARET